MVHFPAHDTPSNPGSAWANPLKKKTQPAGLYKYVHTKFFLIQTRNQSYKRWENATLGHKAQATNVQNTTLQCFEFLYLVELLSDTVRFLNLHFFLQKLRHFWEKLQQFTPCGGRGPKPL